MAMVFQKGNSSIENPTAVYWEPMIEFLQSIGIEVIPRQLDDSCFLPGLLLGPNCIYYDLELLKYPGDLLHEAGHIAVTPANLRVHISSERIQELTGGWPSAGDEIAYVLWSFAAAKHLDIPLDFIFHSNGYKNDSDWIFAQI